MNNLKELENLRLETLNNLISLSSNLRNKESELLKEKINQIFSKFSIINSISWEQFNDYNDSTYDFDLHNLYINEYLIDNFWGVTEEKWQGDELDSAVPYEGFLEESYEKYDEYKLKIKEKHKDLIPAIRSIISELKEIYDNLGEDFFRNFFGIRVKVTINQKQIIIEDYE